ncbi:hypothetical protein B0H63DRAFT_240348 [Podospora didyma]|uniref:Uncharacterized protein n=1 Tax=Podospora didyma TaxID=330526 RepID=A0AAE0KKM5_9PEZI|nr:hypothetical protein B0H63DRAFT_240348 [Podospora didyma]
MTNHARGSSLLQTRKNHNHNHNHNHHHLHSNQLLPRHPHPQDDSRPSNNHIRSPSEELHINKRIVVVQTVAVVQIIDDTGAVISVSTVLSDPVTHPPLDPAAGVTAAGLSALGNALPSVSASGPLTSGDGAPSSAASAQTESASLSLTSVPESVTSTPLSSSTAFPILSSGVFNSSSARLPSLFSNSTVLFANSTRSSSSSSTSLSASSTGSRSSSIRLTSVYNAATATVAVAGGSGDGIAGIDGGPTTSAATPSSGESKPPGLTPAAQSAVIGGVVGSVAGVALIALFLMFILKWKKRQGGAILLLGDADSDARGRGQTSGPEGGGGGMMSRRSIPFAIPSALAKLSGSKRAIEGHSEESNTEEKGFYRVSGRKLMPVLQSGGDGYSDPHHDPHDSMMSGTSYYRDSQAFFEGPPARLQLGSPMRPESGVPIMRSGPGRTPVQEQTAFPFPNNPRPLTPPTIDPLGRSLMPQAGSRGSGGSGSRFTEDM